MNINEQYDELQGLHNSAVAKARIIGFMDGAGVATFVWLIVLVGVIIYYK